MPLIIVSFTLKDRLAAEFLVLTNISDSWDVPVFFFTDPIFITRFNMTCSMNVQSNMSWSTVIRNHNPGSKTAGAAVVSFALSVRADVALSGTSRMSFVTCCVGLYQKCKRIRNDGRHVNECTSND